MLKKTMTQEKTMSPELINSTMDNLLARLTDRTPGGEDLLPLWLSRQEAEAVLQLCAASPALVSEGAEEALFSKLGQLLRAFRS